MKVYDNITELVGNTPLVRIKKTEEMLSLDADIFVKLEYFNPAGSSKDRVALMMINDAEDKGLLKKGSTVIEATSGNTGIGLAAIAAVKGYRVIITMPENMSAERQKLLSAYGAEVVLTDASEGMSGAIKKANKLKEEIPDSIIAGQFINPANPLAHFISTGREIYNDLDGNVDVFVAGVGTGGTITGIAKYLKSQNRNIKTVGVEPYDSPVISGGKAGSHKIQGIGAGFIPKILETEYIDEIIPVKTDEAYSAARNLAKNEGILTGISSGAALHAAYELAKRSENKGKNIVVFLPDGGDKYLSTDLY